MDAERNGMKIVGMGTNTENGIQIFGTTIRIYFNNTIRLGRLCLCRFGRLFLCPGTEHIRILVQYTINLGCRKFNMGFLRELFSIRLHVYVTLFLDHSKRRHSICKFKFGSICVTFEMRCQHESIDSIVKAERGSN